MSKQRSDYTFNGKKYNHIISRVFLKNFQIAGIAIKGQKGLSLTLYEMESHICMPPCL